MIPPYAGPLGSPESPFGVPNVDARHEHSSPAAAGGPSVGVDDGGIETSVAEGPGGGVDGRLSRGEPRRPVVVIGAGITGLVSARRLSLAGVPVILLEASDRIGGQLETVPFAGLPVEMGAEALYLAVPELRRLVAELGLGDRIVAAAPGATWLATDRGLRRLPAGVGPAGPARLRPVLRSGTLGPTALLRAAAEPWRARRPLPGDVSVADFVTHRFGRAVTETFVDPMMGSLHAGDVRRLSLAATSPLLAAANTARRSLVSENLIRLPGLRWGRRSAAGQPGSSAPDRAGRSGADSAGRSAPGSPVRPPSPMFGSLPGGLADLTARILDGTDVDLRLNTPVTGLSLRADDGPFPTAVSVTTAHDEITASAVVVAVPAPPAATLVSGVDDGAARRLTGIPMASVATVAFAFRCADLAALPAFAGTGILLPSASGRTMKAAVFLSSKWRHLGGGDLALVRVSAGRARSDVADTLSDAELIAACRADLAALTGMTAHPVDVRVRRWPQTMPQLEIGHLELVDDARSRLATAGPVVLAGASYDGVGVTSCVRSAEAAAASVLDRLGIDRPTSSPARHSTRQQGSPA